MISKNIKKITFTTLIASLFLLASGSPVANAHASIQAYGQTLTAGSKATLFARIGHGCTGKDVTKVTIKVPASLTGVKAMQLSGWDTSYTKNEAGLITEMTWSNGVLKDGFFADFGFQATLPKTTGDLYIPVIQFCGAESEAWIELPVTGSTATLSYPAPKVVILTVPGESTTAKGNQSAEALIDGKEFVIKAPLAYRNKTITVKNHTGDTIFTSKLDRFGNKSMYMTIKVVNIMKELQKTDMDHIMIYSGTTLITEVELKGINLG